MFVFDLVVCGYLLVDFGEVGDFFDDCVFDLLCVVIVKGYVEFGFVVVDCFE